MGYDIFEEVDKLLEVVDEAVVSGDFTNLRRNVGNIVEPMKKRGYDSRFFANQSQYNYKQGKGKGSKGYSPYQSGQPHNYNAGHMENRGNAFYGTYSGGKYSGGQANSGRTATRYSGSAGAGAPYRQSQSRPVDPLKGETELFKKAEVNLLDTVKQVLGVTGAIGVGLVAVIMIAVTVGLIVSGEMAPAAFMVVLSLFTAAVTAAFIALARNGRHGVERMTRFVKYRSVLMKKSFATVKELASVGGVSEEKAVKELKELTALGFFKQGHFDKKETTFICADEVYRLYQQSEEAERIRRQEEEERKKQADYIPDDVKELLDKGNEYVRKIHEANDRIAGEEVSEKLDRMENIVARIFAEVQKNPSLAGNLTMFMDYYLPTTTKLMDAYIEMDSHPMPGQNIQNSKDEIEGTLDTINDAFENLLDSFFKETALDVSTDISVMKNMMRQQGLTPDDLELIRRQQNMEMAGSPTISEAQAYMKKKEQSQIESSAPTLENIRQQLAEEDARAAREGKKPDVREEKEVEYTAPTLEDIRRQLAEEDARAAREAAAKKAAEKKAAGQERPLSFDEQLELEAQHGLLMTGNGDDDDIF